MRQTLGAVNRANPKLPIIGDARLQPEKAEQYWRELRDERLAVEDRRPA